MKEISEWKLTKFCRVNRHLLQVSKKLFSKDSLRAVYYAHIYSHLMYGLVVWGSMTPKKNLTKLRTIQNSCVWIVGGKPNRYLTTEVYRDTKLPSLDQMIHMELCKFVHWITMRDLPKPILDMLDSKGG